MKGNTFAAACQRANVFCCTEISVASAAAANDAHFDDNRPNLMGRTASLVSAYRVGAFRANFTNIPEFRARVLVIREARAAVRERRRSWTRLCPSTQSTRWFQQSSPTHGPAGHGGRCQ